MKEKHIRGGTADLFYEEWNELCKPSRDAGLRQLEEFLPRAGRKYSNERNYDRGPNTRDNVSLLSPWIRHRLLSEEEVINAAVARFSFSTAEKFIQEVFWRSYFKGWLEHHPSVWDRYQNDVARFIDELEHDTGLRRGYEVAVNGKTEFECFNAWVRELTDNGYLHNHARMWFASIWIFSLKLPWELGADFFLRHLIDGDAASNTLGWRWVAGLHTKGKMYLARRDNIYKYTDGRFDPEDLCNVYNPLHELAVHPTVPLSTPDQIPEREFILLITEDDCLGGLDILKNKISGAIGYAAPAFRSQLKVSDKVKDFTTASVLDTLNSLGAPETCLAHNWDRVVDLLNRSSASSGISDIVAIEPTIGPIKTSLMGLKETLSKEGVNLHLIRRDYDGLVWPFTDRGFFKVKKKIPELLSALKSS
jgi:deoxyribodipyrimidine photo-lyase